MNKDKYFETIAQYELLAKKEIGQNFLIDADKAEAIVDSLGIKEGEKVLEIGCGAGSLTYFLAETDAEITAIDIDEAMIAKTGSDFASRPNVKIINGNAMRFDYSPYSKIVGNLPYYITSGILERVLLQAENAEKAVFMVQKEVISRIFAGPGSKDYSPLNILLSLVGESKKLFGVSRNCFSPIPHVDSAVFEIAFDESRDKETIAAVYKLAKSMFLQRRKTIYNNLKNYLGDGQKAEEILAKAKIEKAKRPEDLKSSDYLTLLSLLH